MCLCWVKNVIVFRLLLLMAINQKLRTGLREVFSNLQITARIIGAGSLAHIVRLYLIRSLFINPGLAKHQEYGITYPTFMKWSAV